MRIRNISLRKSTLSATIVAVMALPGLAQAQSSAEAQTLDKVTVTGSRIKRTEVEGPAPVVVISAADIQKQGFTTVYEALNTLTQFSGSVQNELNQSGFTPNGQFLNLRGLGPGYQLVLLNGQRMSDYPMPYNSTSAAVNLGAIPAAAVERIEILTGGASAIYGSDAVAGVVNIVTKTNYEGDELRVHAGTTTRGGGDTGLFQWTGGKTGDRWSVTYAVEHLEREAILASQRDFMDSYYDNPQYRDNPDRATAVAGVYLYQNGVGYVAPTATGALSTSSAALEAACARTSGEFQTYYSSSTATAKNRCGYFGYPATQAIQNAYTKTSGYLQGTFDFTDSVQGYGQALLYKSSDKGVSSTQFWQTPGYIYSPTAGFIQAQRIFTPEETGGAQKTTYDEKAINLNFGVKGTLADGRFDWDANVNHSRYNMKIERPRFVESAINDYFFGPQLGTQSGYPRYNFNVDRLFSPMSPDTYQSLITNVRDKAESEVSQAQFSFSGDLFQLPAGAVSFAAVLEGAHQEYSLTPDVRSTVDYTGADAIYNLTSTQGGGKRDRYAAGVELSVPILDSLKANIAGRYDKYDDQTNVGGAATWQAGLEWRPVSSLLLRGTYASSFRAPDMHYIYAGYSGAYTTITDAYLCREDGIDPTGPDCSGTDYVYQVFRNYQGDKSLQEEKGKSFTAGIVWDIMDQMSLSVDYYSIKLENQVGVIDSDYLMRNEADCRLGVDVNGNPVDGTSPSCQFFTGLITRNDDPALGDGKVSEYSAYPINQAMMKTQGLDVSWTYKLDTDRWGDFSAKVDYSHTLKLELQRFPGDEVQNIRDDLQYFNLRSKVNWQVNWSRNDWQATIAGYRFGSLPNWGETGRVAPYIIWNGSVSKKITDKATIGLSVANIFNKLAPRDDTYNSYPFFWRAYSPVGRQVFADFSYKF